MKHKYINPNAYAKKHGIPYTTLKDWIKAGKIDPKAIRKVPIERIEINEDYKV